MINITRSADEEYLALVRKVLFEGIVKNDRTGTGTRSLPFQQMRFDLSNNKIPLLTTKRMFVRGIIHEILWYLQGNTNIKYLQDNNVTIWDEWADERGDLGPVYGAQWRRWKRFEPIGVDSANGVIYREADPVDQIAKVIQRLRTNPTDRRLVINAWNVGELDKMALPPCHAMFQFWSDGTNLSCHLYQRSCDVGLGVPFNIVQYSILTRMVAHVTGLQATEFVWTGGDVHIYNNHIEQLKEQLQRKPYPSPILRPFASSIKEIDDFKYEDFVIEGYTCHPTIKMEVAV